MCGIAGIYHFNSARQADAAPLQRMLDVMVHRGPDDQGMHLSGPLAIGMRRLSIIDLHTGHQPIPNEDQSVWVVLNGEIYNYRELRADLQARGHRFSTQSDTETLVHLYEEYGDRFVTQLNGMFGFALWDQRRQRLLLGRDHIGEKQLFYSVREGSIAFGSEIKVVQASGLPSKQVDPEALDAYLTFLYCPAPRTAYADIRELPPASLLVIDAHGVQEPLAYWDLTYRVNRARSADETVHEFNQHFTRAVASRLVSDVPVGALLSGGIDSSAIVAVMAELGGRQPQTFCIGYDSGGAHYDERRYAQQVAQRYGSLHRAFVIQPDIVGLLPTLSAAFDQPFADSSAVANYYVFRETQRHVKVVLSGLGGDEIAAGYERYVAVQMLKSYGRLPRWLRQDVIERAVDRLPDARKGSRLIERIKRFVRTGLLPPEQAYLSYLSAFTRGNKESLYTPAFAARLSGRGPETQFAQAFNRPGIDDLLNRCLDNDRQLYLTGDLLTLADRMSMAHSIEARAPFLDVRLVEFMSTVAPEMKLHGRDKKHLLKRAFRGRLPDDILFRRKQGFTLPLTVWFRNELAPYLRATLSPEHIAATGLFNPSAVTRLLDEHISGKENHHSRIWSLLMLVHWQQQALGGARCV